MIESISWPMFALRPIGFPELPAPASKAHFEIIKKWISDCDQNHECYSNVDGFIPTRLLDIRNKDSGTIRLLVNNHDRSIFGHYATLSHRWGSPQQKSLCTYKSNISELKQGIKISALPRTFQDAVCIAYGIGLQFLWIDSLCIIQDDIFDWETESKLMERVFSSAYCTIAASCSTGSGDGFLKPRPARQSVMMRGLQDPDAAYFVCEMIDDFARDVEQSELNQRGWVLQERALSRRTIYFSERQSYWECGGGVRCETMTRMNNRKASFLGDPNFPRSVDQFAKGLRIELFQYLYRQYSRLALSYPSDRPIAIRGLESRLVSTFGTSGGVGIFDIYLHRSLLWRRAGNTLKAITSFRYSPVPSWSWMAYDGAIKYVDVPLGKVAWSDNIISPFSRDGNQNGVSGDVKGGNVIATSPLELEAPVWELLDADGGRRIMDDPGRAFDQPIKCVILGKSKTSSRDESQVLFWVLLVHPIKAADNIALYERVGVGVLEKHHIALDRPQERRRIR
ncbi:putative tol-like protein [Rosellinia necatrix]|uniref:Putative tol-like protein n=1 Tax=Rosellinia necatrix TaxID=77044 RepID=A0A1W2TJN7_ROSNE|nr:putative tol-like protein [Rosellinia necatrix]